MFTDEPCSRTITIGTFNVLADGLGLNEFLCEGGDAISALWSARVDKIMHILSCMLQTCDVVVTQENDHFMKIMEALTEQYGLNLGGLLGIDATKLSSARSLKTHTQFIELTRGGTEQPSVKDSLHEEHYQHVNAMFQKSELPSTEYSFLEESAKYGSFFAKIYHNNAKDLYRSDDGIGIYYRKDKLELTSISVPGTPHLECAQVSHGDVTVVTNMNSFLRCDFSVLRPVGDEDASQQTQQQFTLYGGHLKSGEDAAMEAVRCRQLRVALDDAASTVNPVIAIDSNNSKLYEAAYSCSSPQSPSDPGNKDSSSGAATTSATTSDSSPCTLSALIEQFGYVDAVSSQHGNECFKMRHGRGGQASKHFQLMFDAIDKILVPNTWRVLPTAFDRNAHGFTRYDPQHREDILALRCSPERRAALQVECRASPQIANSSCSVEAFGGHHILAGLYPNRGAPSDHPPVSCTVQLPQCTP